MRLFLLCSELSSGNINAFNSFKPMGMRFTILKIKSLSRGLINGIYTLCAKGCLELEIYSIEGVMKNIKQNRKRAYNK